MTIVQFINFLHGCGLDVLALGLLDSLLTSLVKKLSQKLKRNAPKTYLTAVPFLLGMLLFALWFLLAFPAAALFSENAALIAQRGFSVGVAARLFGKFSRGFFPRERRGTKRGRAAANFRFCGKRMRGKGREVIPPTASKRLFSESRSREERTKFFSRPRE